MPRQANAIINARFALRQHFGRAANVLLEGDMFIYYERGNPAKSIAPDVYVVLDHDLGDRPVYKLWEEGKPPDFALEVISPSSVLRNAMNRRALYEGLGIGEYFLFQPDPGKWSPRLVGYRLRDGRYEELVAEPDGALASRALGVSLRAEGANLRLRSQASGKEYAWTEEHNEIVGAAGARADAEAATRRRAEERIAELEALLRRRGPHGH